MKTASLWHHPTLQTGGIALAAVLAASGANLLAPVDRALLDTHARWYAALKHPAYPPNLLLIGVDDASVRRFGRLRNWSRARYAALLDKTRTARVVGMDILFTEPDTRDTHGDTALADAVQQAGNVVLPAFVYNEARSVSNETQAQTDAFLHRLERAPSGAETRFPLLNAQTVEPPLPALVGGAAGLAQASVNADPDNVYRRPVLSYVASDADGLVFVPHIATAMVAHATGKPARDLLAGLPLQNGALLLRSVTRRGGSFRDGVGTPAPFLSFADALEKPEAFYRDKIVLVGETVTGTADVRPNALDNGLRGVELNAEIVANLLGAFAPLRDLPTPCSALLLAAAIGLPALLFHRARTIRLAGLGAAGVLLLCTLLMEGAYFGLGLAPPWAPVLLGFTAATLAGGIARAAQEAEQVRRTREQFAAYVAPEQVEELSRNPDALFARMKRVRCAILFSDIRGFTAYSEAYPPEIIDRQMREYLTAMADTVFARHHFLDKFIGDAVMALFGDLFAGGRNANDAAEAVRCAVAILERLDELNAVWGADGLPAFRIGIGIHYGDALFGNVGTASGAAGSRRVQLTALGDSVNLASRLQTATKDYGVLCLVSEAVKNAAQNSPLLTGRVVWRDLGWLTVRGREEKTPVWSVERVFTEGNKTDGQ